MILGRPEGGRPVAAGFCKEVAAAATRSQSKIRNPLANFGRDAGLLLNGSRQ